MKKIIQSVKGTRGFYPYEMALRTWLYGKIRGVSESFGYQEYDGPFIESLELYAAKSGEELVKEQSFVFPDRGGNLITLRPELTPSLARMVAERQYELVYPLRWWSFGPFWRYEKPQKGRTREFFQWNIDLIGADTPEADAELISIAAEFFRSVGLTPLDVKIMVNDRQLMETQMAALNIPTDQKIKVFNVIDKRDKMADHEWEAFAKEEGLSEEQLDGIKKILSDKDLYKSSPRMKKLFSALDALGVADYVGFDARIVRGLDYYTGVVFEGRDVRESSRAILGGGRYDNLVRDVGGDPLSGVGFAMGDVVLTIILNEYGKLPKLDLQPAKVLVSVFNEDTFCESLSVSTDLRRAGIKTIVYPEAVKLGKQFKFANRLGLSYVIVLGPDELKQGNVRVKNLETGEQVSVTRTEAAAYLAKKLP